MYKILYLPFGEDIKTNSKKVCKNYVEQDPVFDMALPGYCVKGFDQVARFETIEQAKLAVQDIIRALKKGDFYPFLKPRYEYFEIIKEE